MSKEFTELCNGMGIDPSSHQAIDDIINEVIREYKQAAISKNTTLQTWTEQSL